MLQSRAKKRDRSIDDDDSTSRWEQVSQLLFFLVLILGLTAILGVDLNWEGQFDLELGDPSTVDIVAPRSTTFESEVLTQSSRNDVVSGIYVYTPLDRNIGRQQTDRVRSVFRFIEVVRNDNFADNAEKIEYLQSIEALEIEDEIADTLLTVTLSDFETIRSETIAVVSEAMRSRILPDELSEVQAEGIRRISFGIPLELESVVEQIAPQFIVPNVFLDEDKTIEAREEAAESVAPVIQEITQGQPIIGVGETVRADHLETLDQLGLLQQDALRSYEIGRAFMASLLAALIIVIYWWRFVSIQQLTSRYLIILLILILLFVAAGRILLISDIFYLYPVISLAMLLTVIIRPRLAMVVVLVIAGLIGFIGEESLEPTVYVAVGSLIAIMLLRDRQRFGSYFRAGALGSIGNIAVILLFRYGPTLNYTDFSVDVFWGLLNGVILSPILTIAGFFLVGLFGILTVVQLQDLSRLDHPLLKELLRKAPGTYHHSIMVANLAEQAAEVIDANGTLVRVGAFYHDIGKMVRPEYFTENQVGVNPHDRTDPYRSAEIILDHVSDGLVMARRYRLPLTIQHFIAEHHGRGVLKVFYEKAKKLKEEAGVEAGLAEEEWEEVDMRAFTYSGPRPLTRESGIVLLADTVEAASSAVRPSTETEIVKLVNKLVDDHLKDGQLNRSNLTMGDLEKIKESFINTLKGRFHIRVQYPDTDDEEDEIPVEDEIEAMRQRRIPTIITRRGAGSR